MSTTAAQRFITRVEQDEAFAAELDALKDDPGAVLARVRAEGFDVTPAEARDAFLERYGAQLGPDELEAIAAASDGTVVGSAVGGAIAGVVIGGFVAATAAAF